MRRAEERHDIGAGSADRLRERALAKVFEAWEDVVEPLPEDVLWGMRAVIEARGAGPDQGS